SRCCPTATTTGSPMVTRTRVPADSGGGVGEPWGPHGVASCRATSAVSSGVGLHGGGHARLGREDIQGVLVAAGAQSEPRHHQRQERSPMITQNDLRKLLGATAHDPDGDKVSRIGQVYYDDDTDTPKWVTVHTGLFGTNESFVPLQGAQFEG